MPQPAPDPALRADVEQLAAMARDSAGAGERASAEWIAGHLRSVADDGRYTDYHLPTDTADRVAWQSVARCLELAEATARELAARTR